MQVAIALHQSRWLRSSVSRMILCGDYAAEKQTEHDHTQNAVVSVIAMFRRHTFSPSAFGLILSTCRIGGRFDELYYASRWRPILTGASGSLACGAEYVLKLTKRPGDFAQSPDNGKPDGCPVDNPQDSET